MNSDHDDGLQAPEVPEDVSQVSGITSDLAGGSSDPRGQMAMMKLEDAHEALENAEGALHVAEARAREEAEKPDLAEWEKLASAEAVRVAERHRRRCVDAMIRADDAVAAAEAEAALRPAAEMAAGEEEAEEEPHYANVYVFVETFLIGIYARHYRPAGQWRWCAHWWEHHEAVARLEALWQAFEALRMQPGTGAATWWRDYADPTMTALTDHAGPFAQCKAGREPVHEIPSPLPIELVATALSAPQS